MGAQSKETQKQKNLAREELRPGSGRLERAAYGGRTQGGGEGAPRAGPDWAWKDVLAVSAARQHRPNSGGQTLSISQSLWPGSIWAPLGEPASRSPGGLGLRSSLRLSTCAGSVSEISHRALAGFVWAGGARREVFQKKVSYGQVGSRRCDLREPW